MILLFILGVYYFVDNLWVKLIKKKMKLKKEYFAKTHQVSNWHICIFWVLQTQTYRCYVFLHMYRLQNEITKQ